MAKSLSVSCPRDCSASNATGKLASNAADPLPRVTARPFLPSHNLINRNNVKKISRKGIISDQLGKRSGWVAKSIPTRPIMQRKINLAVLLVMLFVL